MTAQHRHDGPDQTNRRNHYRVLHVQPDAPFDVIRASYRTLLQKLKLHPDLGGDHWSAAHVNAAYHVLSDPLRRAAYDRQLLAVYDIATVAEGPLTPAARQFRLHREVVDDRRNFYRLLQVQPDAPVELIEASYRALSQRGDYRRDVLDTAFDTLRDPARRSAYDRELGLGDRVPARASMVHPRSDTDTADASPTWRPHTYQPLVTRYCLFCKTPHQTVSSALRDATCVECGSPLAPPIDVAADDARRSLSRMRRSEPIGFYAFWPGARLSATLVDLSPKGMSFQTAAPCSVGDVLKIETPHMQAVGVVARAVAGTSGVTVGVEFRAVGFTSLSGSFISARA